MSNMPISVLRKEMKSLINLEDRMYLIENLDKMLTPDTYGGYNGYTVRSLYFDSRSNQDFNDKLVKSSEQKRIRMRIYTIYDETAKIELKRKSSGRQKKVSLVIQKEDALKLVECDFSVLKKYESETAGYLYEVMTTHDYRPVSIIEYDRRAYTHRDFSTRITLDSNLRYTDFDYNLYSENLNFKKVMSAEKTILEVKYSKFLFSQIQYLLSRIDMSKKPMSKYASSRNLLTNYYY